MTARSKPRRHTSRRQAAEDITSNMSCLAIYAPGDKGFGTRCIGFLFPRGKSGVEAFNAADESPVQNASEAAGAVSASSRSSDRGVQRG